MNGPGKNEGEKKSLKKIIHLIEGRQDSFYFSLHSTLKSVLEWRNMVIDL